MGVSYGTTAAADGDWKVAGISVDKIRRQIGAAARTAVWVHQVHGTDVLEASGDDAGLLGDADAIITSQPGVALTVRIADCVPIFLRSAQGIGIAHAGLAGTADQVLAATVSEMIDRFDCTPDGIRVSVGPHICPECYVRSNANTAHTDKPTMQPFVERRANGDHIDLFAALEHQAEQLGVKFSAQRPKCTKHDDDLFSYRGGDGDLRLLAYIVIDDSAHA